MDERVSGSLHDYISLYVCQCVGFYVRHMYMYLCFYFPQKAKKSTSFLVCRCRYLSIYETIHPVFLHCKKLVACITTFKVAPPKLLFRWSKTFTGSSVSYSLNNITMTILLCLAEHPLLVAKRAVPYHRLTSAHTPHHSTPFLLPHSLILSACLLSRIIHSRAKSQSLSLSVLSVSLWLCQSSPTSSYLLLSPFIISPLSQPELRKGKSHDTCDVWWKSGEQSGTEVSQPISVHESCGCETQRGWNTEREMQ